MAGTIASPIPLAFERPSLLYVAQRPYRIGVLERTTAMAQTGTVKFFNSDKGFGFIKPDNGGPDIFVHVTGLQQSGLQSLAENQAVSFDVEPDNRGKGPKAVNVQAL